MQSMPADEHMSARRLLLAHDAEVIERHSRLAAGLLLAISMYHQGSQTANLTESKYDVEKVRPIHSMLVESTRLGR